MATHTTIMIPGLASETALCDENWRPKHVPMCAKGIPMNYQKLLRRGMLSYAGQRLTTYWPVRKRFASLAAMTKPKHSRALSQRSQVIVSELEREGIHFMRGHVDAACLAAIHRHLDGHIVHEGFSPFRKNLRLDSMPNDVHVGRYPADVIVTSDELMGIANDPALLEVAAGYLGCKPTIANLGLWWSFPTDGSAQEAENFHRDVDDWKFLKLFVYLTDVGPTAGPHAFVKGSHRSTKFLRLRRLEESEVANEFPAEKILSITGKAGDAFFEDTFGIHRGVPPITERRLLFQVEYAINPLAVSVYQPVPSSRRDIDPYTNRLYLRSQHA